MFIPYGERYSVVVDPETGKPTRVLQKFDEAAANTMIAEIASFSGLVDRVMRHIPIFEGHPDDPLFRETFRDQRAYGWVSGVPTCNSEGMTVPVKYTPLGQDAVSNGIFKFYSQRWDLAIDRTTKPWVGKPIKLRSIGLVNMANWPNPALSNAEIPEAVVETPVEVVPSEPPPPPPAPLLLDRIKALLGSDKVATEEDVVGWVSAAIQAIRAMRKAIDDRWSAESKISAAAPNAILDEDRLAAVLSYQEQEISRRMQHEAEQEQQVTAANAALLEESASRRRLETELADVRAQLKAVREQGAEQLTAANARYETERGARISQILDTAIAAGQITLAQRPGFEAQLRADLDAGVAAVSNAKPMFKVQPATHNLPSRKPGNVTKPGDELRRLATERMGEKQCTWDEAWIATCNAHQDLVNACEQAARPYTGNG